jgi:hypothetical protein
VNEAAESAFVKLCNELEKSCDTGLHTLDELHTLMKQLIGLQYDNDDDEGLLWLFYGTSAQKRPLVRR